MAQLSFQWPANPSRDARDFMVSQANAEAARFLENWPDGRAAAALVSGPASCGKTHLASAWAGRTGAVAIDADALGVKSSEELWSGARHAVLEDIHAITRQTALFHLLRHGETQGAFLLMTARAPAAQLHFALSDLRSRLLALPQAAIGAPDEALLKGVLLKDLADRQLRVGKGVIAYLLKRMDRSFAAAHALVDALEKEALTSGRALTVPLARKVLA